MSLPLKFYWHELAAYGISIISLAIGIFFAHSGYPDPIGSAGSVMIVCGVLLAVSRKHDDLLAKTLNFIKSRRAANRAAIRESLTSSQGHSLSDEELEDVHQQSESDAIAIIEDLINQQKRLFKFHEILLVVIGTLINGFGPLVTRLLLEIPLK